MLVCPFLLGYYVILMVLFSFLTSVFPSCCDRFQAWAAEREEESAMKNSRVRCCLLAAERSVWLSCSPHHTIQSLQKLLTVDFNFWVKVGSLQSRQC